MKVFTGTTKNDVVSGSNGDDYLYGYYGDDRLSGKGGNDIVRGSFGNDTLDGGDGADMVDGNEGDDKVYGGRGPDILRGGTGNDLLDGGDANDVLVGGLGRDVMAGGKGKDIFAFSTTADSATKAADSITDFNRSEDVIDLSSIDARTGQAGGQTFAFIGAKAFTAEGQVRAYEKGDHTFVEVNTTGKNGAEMVLDLTGKVALSTANFRFTGNVNTDDARESVKIGDGGFVHGESELTANDPGRVDRLYGGGGNDYVRGDGDTDIVRGGVGDDTLDGGYGYDALDGSLGNDLIYGGAGDFFDILRGQEGNDLLDGGAGGDVLDGGAGKDTFVFKAGFGGDTVTDFKRGEDVLRIDIKGVDDRSDLAFSGSTITVAGHGTITLNDVSVAGLGNGDFDFV